MYILVISTTINQESCAVVAVGQEICRDLNVVALDSTEPPHPIIIPPCSSWVHRFCDIRYRGRPEDESVSLHLAGVDFLVRRPFFPAIARHLSGGRE